MKSLLMPELGMAMTDGLIVQWLHAPGDLVTTGEPLVEIETEKSTVQIESPGTGRLGPLLFKAGDVAPVGACLVAIIEEGDEDVEVRRAAEPEEGQTVSDRSSPTTRRDRARSGTTGTVPEDISSPRHHLSPRQRRLLSEQEEVVIAATASPAAARASLLARDRFRAAIAERVTRSWQTIPHFSVTRELMARPLIEMRQAGRQKIPDLGITDLLCRALGKALGGIPPVSLGLAVDTKDGVVVSVLPDVVGTNLADLVAQRRAAVARAIEGLADERDVTITPQATMSNMGSYGVDQFTGIIPPGQGLLVTVGRIAQRVVAVDGAAVVLPTFIMTVVADHRQYDGADLARLISSFASGLSDDPSGATREQS
jgi:pyruvate dehydrogenase E2 component (dihydrolipoamide acetyltransferase)